MGLKALVTGSTGFVGSNLTRELVKRGWKVYALIRRESNLNCERLNNNKNIKYIYAEELFNDEYNKIKILPQFDACFHLAAYGVDYTKQNINELINGNIKFTLNVINFCKENMTKKVINTGSCFEYGFNEGKKLNEESNITPQSLYGATKASSVIIANSFSTINNIPLITIRPFGVFGEYEGLHRFVPQVMKSVIFNENIKMTYGEQVRDYLYINDLVNAYITLATTEVPLYEVYNVCSGVEVTIKDLALYIARISNNSSGIFDFGSLPYRKNEVMYFVGDNSKIKKYTSWKPTFTLEEGLIKTYQWYKTNLEDLL